MLERYLIIFQIRRFHVQTCLPAGRPSNVPTSSNIPDPPLASFLLRLFLIPCVFHFFFILIFFHPVLIEELLSHDRSDRASYDKTHHDFLRDMLFLLLFFPTTAKGPHGGGHDSRVEGAATKKLTYPTLFRHNFPDGPSRCVRFLPIVPVSGLRCRWKCRVRCCCCVCPPTIRPRIRHARRPA